MSHVRQDEIDRFITANAETLRRVYAEISRAFSDDAGTTSPIQVAPVPAPVPASLDADHHRAPRRSATTAALRTSSTTRRSAKKHQADAPPEPSALEQRYLSTAQAALYTGYPESTLEKWRVQGKGPPWSKAPGSKHVRYDKLKLDAWMEANERRSTIDPGSDPNDERT
jgi:hypothetical protein